MPYVLENNVKTQLNAGIDGVTTTIVVNAATAPSKSPPDPAGGVAVVTLVDRLANPTKLEIISYTGRTGVGPYTLTGCTRGFEGTSAYSWTTTDIVFQALTGAIVDTFRTTDNGSFAGRVTADDGANSLTTTTSNSPVVVSGAAPPSAGQVLTAGSATTADWQDSGVSPNLPARNGVLNQDAVSQGASTRTGFSATTYTGNGTSQSVATGVDMATGNFGGLVWLKSRSGINNHLLSDTVRGLTSSLYTDSTSAEGTSPAQLTSFDANGFTIGSDGIINTNLATHISWSWQTTKKTTGTTNRNKAYTAHYNPDMGFSIVGYVGDGIVGHEIPHHLGVVPELSIYKSRSSIQSWIVYGTVIPGNYLILEKTDAMVAVASQVATPTSIGLNGGSDNLASQNIISYHFASVEGFSKIGKYIGTGVAGNYVDCGFKPAWVMVKNLSTAATDWIIQDSTRIDLDLHPNLSAAEAGAGRFQYTDTGFLSDNLGGANNAQNAEYIFMAFADSNATTGRGDYSYPTTADTLTIEQNTLLSFANGFNATGQNDTQETVGAGITYALGSGHENKHYYLYKDKGSTYGVTENRPLIGITRNDADKWGVVSPSDVTLRTTSKHFDYESDTGVALASGELGARYAWSAFIKGLADNWQIATITTSWLQYKSTEKRILKSWRMRETSDQTFTPDRFTIEGSNDGLNWTEIDATYKVTTGVAYDTVALGSNLYGPLQDTSSNVTPYLYHRINITENNGHVSTTGLSELELNTILPSDYYLIEEGVMYDSSDVAIERIYLAEFYTDSAGDVINNTIINHTPAKQQITDAEVHGDMTVHGDIENRGVATAWVRFDGTQNPPLILDSYNVADVVDEGMGIWRVIFETPMDSAGYNALVSGPAASGTANNFSCGPSSWTTQDVTVNNERADGTATDSASMNVTIFGGKKIL